MAFSDRNDRSSILHLQKKYSIHKICFSFSLHIDLVCFHENVKAPFRISVSGKWPNVILKNCQTLLQAKVLIQITAQGAGNTEYSLNVMLFKAYLRSWYGFGGNGALPLSRRYWTMKAIRKNPIQPHIRAISFICKMNGRCCYFMSIISIYCHVKQTSGKVAFTRC